MEDKTTYIKKQLFTTLHYLRDADFCLGRPQRFIGWIENEIMNENVVVFPEAPLTLNAWGPALPLSAEALGCEDYETEIVKEEMINFIMNELCNHILGFDFEIFKQQFLDE